MRTSDVVYEELRMMITMAKLEPGSVLNENDLMAKLGAGRTPIREALNRLNWEHFVRIIPRQCIIVSDLPFQDLESIYQVRYTLSSLEGELAANRRNEEDLKKLESIINQLRVTNEQEDRALLDREFHMTISQSTRNRFLIDEMNTLLDLSLRLIFLNKDRLSGIDESLLDDYENIYKHIWDKNCIKLIKILQEHVEDFYAKFYRL